MDCRSEQKLDDGCLGPRSSPARLDGQGIRALVHVGHFHHSGQWMQPDGLPNSQSLSATPFLVAQSPDVYIMWPFVEAKVPLALRIPTSRLFLPPADHPFAPRTHISRNDDRQGRRPTERAPLRLLAKCQPQYEILKPTTTARLRPPLPICYALISRSRHTRRLSTGSQRHVPGLPPSDGAMASSRHIMNFVQEREKPRDNKERTSALKI